ncbi:MAG: hypothetical protein ABW007_09910 [Chitinophagaceae bacterium]
MKNITALLVLLFSWKAAFNQQVYFVYLQSEDGQPFFLKMNEQVRSANASGYLILSGLKDSSYSFSIGFPQNKWPEQTFTLCIRGKDKGFLLKKDDTNNWNLVDLQSEQLIAGENVSGRRSVRTEPKEVSAFTDILSKATDDPSLKERVIPIKAVAKADEKTGQSVPGQKKEVATPVIEPVKTELVVTEGQNQGVPARVDSSALPAVVEVAEEKKTEEKKADVIDLTAKDTLIRRPAVTPPVEVKAVASATEKKDTIAGQKVEPAVIASQAPDTASKVAAAVKKEDSLNVRAETVLAQKKEEPVLPSVEVKKEESIPVPQQEYKASKVKRRTESSTSEGFGVTYIDEYPDGKNDTIQIFIPNPRSITRNIPPPQEDGNFLPMDSDAKDLTPATKEKAAKSDCSSMASETDYLKLRKKMVATDGDDAMLAAAKKVFKGKCFTTEQVKNLGTLFLNDAGRYNFFDAAYLSVSDSGNFSGLETELKDPYYISRFKAMLR